MSDISENEYSEEMKECQKCGLIQPREKFSKKQDRKGTYTWKQSYCGKCLGQISLKWRAKHKDSYKKYRKTYSNDYYYKNIEKAKIIQKRYYYNKLSPEKQVIYRQKLEKKSPELVDQICN